MWTSASLLSLKKLTSAEAVSWVSEQATSPTKTSLSNAIRAQSNSSSSKAIEIPGSCLAFFARAGTTALPIAGHLVGMEQTRQHTWTKQNQAVIVSPHVNNYKQIINHIFKAVTNPSAPAVSKWFRLCQTQSTWARGFRSRVFLRIQVTSLYSFAFLSSGTQDAK